MNTGFHKAFSRPSLGLVAAILPLALVACHRNQTQPPSGPVQLTLLHTNDIHASISPRPFARDGSGPVGGGFIALDGEVDYLRGEIGADHVLLLDGGDLLTGGPASEIAWEGVPAGGLFTLMNLVGYDAWTLGNHEFDGTREDLGKGVDALRFPTVEANLHLSGGAPLFPQLTDSRIVERAGLKIGLVGLMTEDLGGVLPPSHLEGLELTTAVEAAQREVASLDGVADLIVFITHMGVDADVALAKAVPSIDVIVGGHSHTPIDPAIVEGHTIIVQAGSHLTHLGRLDLVVEGGEVTEHHSSLIALLRGEEDASPEVVEVVRGLEKEADARYGRVIASLVEPWMGAYRTESNVGDWLCDQLRLKTGSDVAFLNSGGIRSNLPPGPMTQGALRTVLPFDNRVATFRLTGEELMTVLQHNAEAEAWETHGILQVGGLRYSWSMAPSVGEEKGAVTLSDVTVGGEPIDPARTYTAASVDYVVYALPDKYLGFVPAERTPDDMLLYQAMADAAEAVGEIHAPLDGRIRGTRP